jgi:hypothetical protein
VGHPPRGQRGGGWPPVSTSASCPARHARTWRQLPARWRASRQLPAREGARGRDAPSAEGDAPLREGAHLPGAGGGAQARVLSPSLDPNAIYKAWQGALWLGFQSQVTVLASGTFFLDGICHTEGLRPRPRTRRIRRVHGGSGPERGGVRRASSHESRWLKPPPDPRHSPFAGSFRPRTLGLALL